jgi:hypothetical protein
MEQQKKGPKGKPSQWIRSGGNVGDPTMERMETWNQDGAGVEENEKAVDAMPSESILIRSNQRTDKLR